MADKDDITSTRSPWLTGRWKTAPSKINIFSSFTNRRRRESRPGDLFGDTPSGVSQKIDPRSRLTKYLTFGLLLFSAALVVHIVLLISR